jgi:hypothetical protein
MLHYRNQTIGIKSPFVLASTDRRSVAPPSSGTTQSSCLYNNFNIVCVAFQYEVIQGADSLPFIEGMTLSSENILPQFLPNQFDDSTYKGITNQRGKSFTI